jgi:glycosyltransferase involved in cell wall biosynthesis
VVESFAVSDIQAAVHRLLAEPGALHGMRAAARASAQERFDYERMLDQWEDVLRGGAIELRAHERARAS